MSAEEEENIRSFVRGLTTAVITKPSTRDKQRVPGPSDLADPCDICVTGKIAHFLGMAGPTGRNFSLKAWNGTAVHEKLERDLPGVYQHALLEITVEIGDIPGIGPVRGHADLYLPRKKTLVDYKTSDLKKIRGYQKGAGPAGYLQNLTAPERDELTALKAMDRGGLLGDAGSRRLVELTAHRDRPASGVPLKYLGQTMLYLYGLRAMGYDVEYAVLQFIPRDSNNVDDLWTTSCAYRSEVAQGVINRAADLADRVRSGRVKDLEPHAECYPCVIEPRIKGRTW